MKLLFNSIFLSNNLLKLNPISKQIKNRLISDSLMRFSLNTNSTVNEEELNKFRSLDGSDWWSGRQFEALRAMNELRVPFIRDSFNFNTNTSKPLSDIKLLDIGCGAGLLSEPLARLGADVTGIDPIDSNIEIAVNHSKSDRELTDKLKYECITVEELTDNESNIESYDGIIASEVIEHIDNVDLFITSSLKCLKTGGKLFITTINQTPIALFAAIIMAENVLQLLPKGTHEYNKFVSPQALTFLLQEHNCDVTLIHGMGYNPLTRRWFWTQNQTINYAVKAVKR